ncbi:anaerobic ribonucleoside-triphosphate reductase, partial [bacterium]|nr:anaerobic ribonucleoside-triphosphate reductase [bacterium]
MEFGTTNTLSHSSVTDAIKNSSDSLGNIISFSRRNLNNITIIKKDGTKEKYNVEKVVAAIKKSAQRTLIEFTDKQIKDICAFVNKSVLDMDKDSVAIAQMHNIVESALQALSPEVAESYRNYRNYKTDFVHMLDKVYQESQRIMYIGDKENANAD